MSQQPGFYAALGEGAQCDSLHDSRAPVKRHPLSTSRAAMLGRLPRVCVVPL
jgi:hypothetical protein